MLHIRGEPAKSIVCKVQIADDGKIFESDKKIRVHVRAVTGQKILLRRGSTADFGFSFKNADLETAFGHVSRTHKAVVTAANYDTVIGFHPGARLTIASAGKSWIMVPGGKVPPVGDAATSKASSS